MTPLQNALLKTLLYYDIWSHPLTRLEAWSFLPLDPMTFADFERALDAGGPGEAVGEERGHLFVRARGKDTVDERTRKELHAARLWRGARMAAHVLKRCPFVRGVMVSGDLSKNATAAGSDVDFVVVTEPGRLWIARALLTAFKKVFLFNSRKYFCLNYFLTAGAFGQQDRNIFVATEVAHTKPLVNGAVYRAYMEANGWVLHFFPNFSPASLFQPPVDDRPSAFQRLLEIPFRFLPADALDRRLMELMRGVWSRRYPHLDEATRARIFRCTREESCAYAGNFEEKILDRYRSGLLAHGIGA